MAKEQSQRLQAFKAFLFSRRAMAVVKGTLAYAIALSLACLSQFDGLFKYPQAQTSMMLVIVAGMAGKSVGSVCINILFAMTGVLVGCLNFLVLAKLSHATVGQAFYFAFVVYVLAYIKARKPAMFSFSLLGILMSFNGVYNGYLVGKKFDHLYMLSYFYAYLWGAAIVLFVNIFVFPVTAERELRELMVLSLEHLETFGLLIYKSYTMNISLEDKALRDSLAQSIRADFGRMSGKLAESALEVNWSRWSMEDYRFFIGKIRLIQQALISTHSSMSKLEAESDRLYKSTFVPRSLKSYNRVIIDLRIGIQEIKEEFGAKHQNIPGCLWESYMDIEREAINVERPSFECRGVSLEDGTTRSGQLEDVSRRLAAEFAEVDNSDDEEMQTPGSRFAGTRVNLIKDPRTGTMSTTTAVGSPTEQEKKLAAEAEKKTGAPSKGRVSTPEILQARGVQALEADFAAYRDLQYDLINTALTSGTLVDCADKTQLRVHTKQPSIYEAYGMDYIRGAMDSEQDVHDLSPLLTPPLAPPLAIPKRLTGSSLMHKRSKQTVTSGVVSDDESEHGPETVEQVENHSLVVVHSMLFSLGQYVKELTEFHARATARDAGGKPRPKRLHFHLFESISHHPEPASAKENTDLSLGEAMAMLEGRPYVRKTYTWGERIHQLRAMATDTTSLFALKSAAAATVFAMFIYCESTRLWFVQYALSSGLLTIVVALAPTLGQTAITFILQISGSSIGYLLGLAVLSIFNNVGGYKYNPYGVVCLMTLFSVPMQYVMYEYPQYWAFGLLSLNGAGVLVITEWVYRVHDHVPTFDSPAYRTAKALTATAMAVAVCGLFQLFILRNPARRSLRNALAKVAYENLAYLTMLHAFVRAAVPANPNHQVPVQAVARVNMELKKREMQIQADIIAMMPLITFSAAEPSLSKPFNPRLPLRLIRVNQIMLDRLREARFAIGTTRLDETILKNFVSVLSPYRRRSARAAKNILGMCASTLNAKTPLPQDMPFLGRHKALADLVHDGLVLSYRFANTEEGRLAARTGDFTRYWFYVVSVNSIFPQLDEFEAILEEMFGRLEDSLA